EPYDAPPTKTPLVAPVPSAKKSSLGVDGLPPTILNGLLPPGLCAALPAAAHGGEAPAEALAGPALGVYSKIVPSLFAPPAPVVPARGSQGTSKSHHKQLVVPGVEHRVNSLGLRAPCRQGIQRWPRGRGRVIPRSEHRARQPWNGRPIECRRGG